MTDVDRRVVELEFDNAKFEKNARSTIKALDDLDAALELKDSTKGLTELERVGKSFSLKNVSDNVERIADSYTLLGRVVLKIKDTIANSLSSSIFQVKRYADEYIGLLTTMSQASAGFAKYEKKTSAVQAIKSALPDTDMETITKALDDLNKYTDETSYDFTEMVATIGKFTANGVKLEDAVEAMKGIGNEAAKSGASIQEANRAMYNFSQALATGSVKLIDWKSIENANMATKEFKEQIIQSAIELGVLKKQGDKVLTKKGTVVDFTKFSATLNEGWFTKDVLVDVLGKYADTTTKFGLDAFHAAQQAKTLKEAIDAVKDSASTGWMKTYELIFGNLDEAIELFTGLANRLIEITDTVAEWRNGLLEGWRELGGREDLIKGLSDAFEGLWNIVRTVSDGIHEVFPSTTAENLKQITSGIRDFGETFRNTFGINEKEVQRQVSVFQGDLANLSDAEGSFLSGMIKNNKGLKQEFEALSSTLREGTSGDDVKKLQERLKSLGYDLGDAGVDGIFGPKTKAALENFQKDYGLTIDGIYGKLSHSKLMELVSKPQIWTKELTETKTITEYSDTILKLRSIVAGASSVVSIFGKVLSFAWGVIKNLGTALKPVANVLLTAFAGIGDYLVGLEQRIDEAGWFTKWLETIAGWLEPVSSWLSSDGDAFLRFFGFVKNEGDANKETLTFSKIIENLRKKFEDYGVFEKFAQVIEKISNVFAKAKEKIGEYFNKIKEYFTDRFLTKQNDDGTKSILSYADVLSSVGSFLAKVFSGFLDIVIKIVDKIPAIAKNIGDFFSKLFSGVDIKGAGQSFLSGISDFFKTFWETITSLFSWNNDKKKDDVENGFSLIDWIMTKIARVWAIIKSIIMSLSSRKNGTSSDVDGQKDEITKVFDFFGWLSDKLSNLWSTVKSIPSSIMEFLDKYDVLGKVEGLLVTLNGLFIGKALLNVTKLGKGLITIGQTFADTKLTEAKTKKWKVVASVLLSMAALIGVIAAAIYILGNMDRDKLMRGVTAIGGIIIVLTVFGLLIGVASKLSGEKTVAESFKGIAALLAVVVASIWVLAKMDDNTVRTGFERLALLLSGLLIFVSLLNGSSMNLSGLKELSIFLAVLVGSLFVIGKMMSDEQMWKGLKGIGVLLLYMGVFIIAISKLGATSVSLKGLIGVAAAIGILTLVVFELGLMPDRLLKKGLMALTAIGAIFASVGAVFGTIGKNINIGGVLVIAGAFAVLMVVLGYVMKMIKNVDPRVMLSFASALAIGLAAIVAACLFASNERLGGGIKNMAKGAAAISAAIDILALNMVALVASLGKIDDLTDGDLTDQLNNGAKVLESLGKALSSFNDSIGGGSNLAIAAGGLLAASGVAGKFASKILIGSLVISGAIDIIVGNLELLVGGSGWIDKVTNGGFVDSMERGGKVLTLLGEALSSFNDSIGGDSSLAKAAAAFLGASFVTGFFSGQFLTGALAVSGALDIIVVNLELLVGVNGWVNKITNGGWADTLEEGGKVLRAFGTAIGSFAGGIREGFQNKEKLSEDLTAYGEALEAFRTGVDAYSANETEIRANAEAAIRITQIIHDFFADMEMYPINWGAIEGYATAPAQVSTDMTYFAEAIMALRTGVDGLSTAEEIDADVSKAFSVTKSVKKFFDEIVDEMPSGSGLAEYNSKLTSLFGNVDEFGTNIADLSTKISGAAKSGIVGNTLLGIAASKSLLYFFEQVAASGDKIDITKPGWQVFFTGETVTNSFFDQANRFGDAVKKLATEHLGGIDSAKLVTDAENAKTALTTMAEFMTFVSSDFRIKTWIDEIPTNDTSRIEKFADQLDSLMFKTSDFAAWTNAIDEGHATAIANVMRTMAETMNYISGMTMNGTEVTLFADAIGVLGQSLPEFETVGHNITVAILNGMTVGNGDLIAQAAIALKNAIIEALAFTDEELANILTITPVIDTTAMETSLRSMQNRKLNVGTVASRANGSIGAAEATRNSQSSVINNDVTNTATVTVTGNTFKVNDERDINALANKIAALVNQQQRSFGSPPKLV